MQHVKHHMVISAWYYAQGKRYLSHPDRNAYAAAEKQAKTDKLGLWADAYPVPPWDIRRPKKHGATVAPILP